MLNIVPFPNIPYVVMWYSKMICAVMVVIFMQKEFELFALCEVHLKNPLNENFVIFLLVDTSEL